MTWPNAYIGIPWCEHGRDWQGCDCYGLLRLIYDMELGIALPSFAGDYVSTGEQAQIARLINGAEAAGDWLPVTGVRAFDVVVMRDGRYATHLGVVVRPGVMIHAARKDQVKLERYDSAQRLSRLKGVYRHVSSPVQQGAAA